MKVYTKYIYKWRETVKRIWEENMEEEAEEENYIDM